MKYVKMLGLAAVAAAALMAFVGASSASATQLTCTSPPESGIKVVCPAGTTIHAINEGTLTLTGGFKNIECKSGTVHGKTTNAGSSTETVDGPIEFLTFGECNCTVVVVKKGTLEIHTENNGTVANGNGTLTSNGATVTAQCNSIFGPVHCNYETKNTHLGTLTGSSNTGTTATMDITAKIPIEEEGSDALCAEESVWHAKYSITEPDWLDVD